MDEEEVNLHEVLGQIEGELATITQGITAALDTAPSVRAGIAMGTVLGLCTTALNAVGSARDLLEIMCNQRREANDEDPKPEAEEH